MFINFDHMRQFGTSQFEAATATTVSTAKGLQAIAKEAADYSKRTFENSYELAEKLLRARRLDEIVELQSGFATTTYGDFVDRTTRFGNLYSDLVKDAFKPARITSAAQPPVATSPLKVPVAAKQS